MSVSFNNAFFEGAIGKIHVYTIDDAPWFFAEDVCRAAGMEMRAALNRLDEDEKKTVFEEGKPESSRFKIISESGLYFLLLLSCKDEALRMKRWVFHDVIPTIRRDGGYLSIKEGDTQSAIIARAVRLAAKALRRQNGMEEAI